MWTEGCNLFPFCWDLLSGPDSHGQFSLMFPVLEKNVCASMINAKCSCLLSGWGLLFVLLKPSVDCGFPCRPHQFVSWVKIPPPTQCSAFSPLCLHSFLWFLYFLYFICVIFLLLSIFQCHSGFIKWIAKWPPLLFSGRDCAGLVIILSMHGRVLQQKHLGWISFLRVFIYLWILGFTYLSNL